MAVTAVTLHWAGATGDVTSESLEYTAVYRVTTDATATGPAAIAAYFRTNGPWLNSSYSYGGDSDSTAKCTKVSIPRHVQGSANVWEVTFTFSTAAAGGGNSAQQVDSSGNPTQNPLEFRPLVWMTGSVLTVPTEEAIYEGGFGAGRLPILDVGTKYRVQNSAGDRIDSPPLETEVDIQRIYVRVNKASVDVSKIYGGVIIMDANVRIRPFLGYTGRLASSGQLKLAEVSVQPKRESVEINGVRQMLDYFEITSELHWKGDGWLSRVYDIGVSRKAKPGDPDGKGGTISFTDALAGKAPRAPILDPVTGSPIRSPVLLDGEGQPLNTVDMTPVVITWRTMFKTPLFAMPYLTDALESF